MTTLPSEFCQRLEHIVPEELYEDVLATYSMEKPVAVRRNPLKCSLDEFHRALKDLFVPYQTVDWYPDAVTIDYDNKSRVTHSDFYNNGLCYIQSLSSLLPVLVLDPQPGEEILDLCSAPGSKTSQIAGLMNDQGRIAAVEKSKHRFFKLLANLKKQGATCVDTYLKDGNKVWRYCENRFDRVLVDAPCSSEGRFDLNNPESVSYWSPKKIRQMTRLQWPLLQSGFLCTKPGGTLVYSTCTLAPEENEAMLDKLIKRFPDTAVIESVKLPINNTLPGLGRWLDKYYLPVVGNALHILPNKHFDSFFVAKIHKKS